MPFYKGDQEITSLSDWKRLAGLKSCDQWVSDRSAKECARAWLQDGGQTFPSEVTHLIESHPNFGPAITWRAEPEAKLRFDAFAGEPRNTDILVQAQDAYGSYILAVEAKADEPFGATVAETLAEALERKLVNPRSNGVARVEQLCAALLGPRANKEPRVGILRYQLLTATAGALCEAERQGADRAVVLIHEFVTRLTQEKNHCRNAADLDRFLQRLSHGAVSCMKSTLAGPFQVPGKPLLDTPIRLYFGKVSQNLRT